MRSGRGADPPALVEDARFGQGDHATTEAGAGEAGPEHAWRGGEAFHEPVQHRGRNLEIVTE